MAGTISTRQADVLVITAVKEEYDAALLIDAGALDVSWRREISPTGFEVAFRRYSVAGGASLQFALTRALDMRGVATANAAWPLIEAYKPRCLAMCGVCAGRRGSVGLGDVIVGDILYTYDTGAIVVERPGGRLKRRYRGEPSPYRIPAVWKSRAESFVIPPNASWLIERPNTIENQCLWLLDRLLAGDAEPDKHAECSVRCADWKKVVEQLRKQRWVSQRGLALTASGRRHIEEVRLLHQAGLPKQAAFQVRVGPIATGSSVMRDPQIFERLSESMRKVLGVEMEAAAIGAIAHVANLPMLVMKGVMDHADGEKDDGFKYFAARASAECLFLFLRENISYIYTDLTHESGQSMVASSSHAPHYAKRGQSASISGKPLPAILGELPVTSSFEGRTALLNNIPFAGSLTRSEAIRLLDLQHIVDGLKKRKLPDGRPTLTILIENAMVFADGTELWEILRAQKQALEA